MNPSAADWIPKFLAHYEKKELLSFKNARHFYEELKKTGFIYGVSVGAIPKKKLSNLKLTKEEHTKVNLFHALYFYYFQHNPEGKNEDAISSIVSFYRQLEKGKTGFLKKLSLSHTPSQNLENIFSARLQETNTLLKKNTISLLTYALLYLDVLTYEIWLKNPEKAKEQYRTWENAILASCFFTIKSKRNKNKFDKLMIELFETSPEYIIEPVKNSGSPLLESLNYLTKKEGLEKKYILDLCCLTVWEDLQMDEAEHRFLQQLTETLLLDESELIDSLMALKSFSEKHTEKIFLFEYSHPVNQFYKQSAATVKLLIIRNKDRLAREMEKSGELMVLLGSSTVRDLTKEEKKKVKEQLLDICKSIPSLTIFLLPGGGVLLPLLVKFIPKLLPSSFQDNRIK